MKPIIVTSFYTIFRKLLCVYTGLIWVRNSLSDTLFLSILIYKNVFVLVHITTFVLYMKFITIHL